MTLVVESTSAGLTLAGMKTALMRYGFNDEDPLTAWLNAAMHDLESDFDWPWLETVNTSITMPSGSSTITLPEDVLKIIVIRDVTNNRKLEYYDRRRFARDIQEPTKTGKAEVYTLVNTNEVQLWRVLESETTFEVVYQATTPDLVTDADSPKTASTVWPANTNYPIVVRAAAIALQAENEEERAKVASEQYEKMLEKLRKKFAERELDEPLVVADVMGYGQSGSRYGY